MTEGVLIAAFGIVAVAIGGLYALMWQHINQCSGHHTEMGQMREAISRHDSEIGDRNSGIRGELHAQADALTRHEMQLAVLERHKCPQD